MSEDRSGTQRRPVNVITGTLIALVLGVMLMGLLMPTVRSGPAPKGAQCINNERYISHAILHYESAKQRFPWYASNLRHLEVCWVVPLLPQLGRNDLYDLWQSSPNPTVVSDLRFDLLFCPLNDRRPSRGAWLSYVANSGEARVNSQANGIFFDGTLDSPIATDAAYVARHDGTSNTILLAENLQAEKWTVIGAQNARIGTTLVWHATQPVRAQWKINSLVDASTPNTDLTYARPSSNHVGGSVIAFCDGSARFISEDIDYDVYCQLMTPFGNESSDPVNRPITDADMNKW